MQTEVSSKRDNFTAQVIRILSQRSGGKCAICLAATWGPNKSSDKSTNIGQAAHITAAAKNGPRYNQKMSSNKRSSALNGIWLCGNCHSKVDKNVLNYPVKVLKERKRKAEEDAKKQLGKPPARHGGADTSDPVIVATSASAIMKIRKVKRTLVEVYQGDAQCQQPNELLDRLQYIDMAEDMYLPAVATELVKFYWLLVTSDNRGFTWLQVVRLLREVTAAHLGEFSQEAIDLTTETVCHMIEHKMVDQLTFESATAFLFLLSKEVEQINGLKNTPSYKLVNLCCGTRRVITDSNDVTDHPQDDDDNVTHPAIEESDDQEERFVSTTIDKSLQDVLDKGYLTFFVRFCY